MKLCSKVCKKIRLFLRKFTWEKSYFLRLDLLILLILLCFYLYSQQALILEITLEREGSAEFEILNFFQ